MRIFAALFLASSFAIFASDLDPRGKIHIPIGVPNSLDTLKTFVEAEGNFSPGFASFGVYFSIFDPAAKKLIAPTMPGVKCDHGLAGTGWLIPWSEWHAGAVRVRTEVCEVKRESPAGELFVVGARAHLANTASSATKTILYVTVRPIGAAGAPLYQLGFRGGTLFVSDQPAVVPDTKPTATEAPSPDVFDDLVPAEKLPRDPSIRSPGGGCSGAMRFEVELAPGERKTFGFVCPVLPGRRAARHEWDSVSKWAQLDEADPIHGRGGVEQPAPGVEFFEAIQADDLFAEAEAYWKNFVGRVEVSVPDKRWVECFAAITGHAAMAMNEGAPDVAVINYNVFNRDGVYVANILQKSGNFALAREAIDWFLARPFNGRVEPEADNPGQVLWILGEHWLFTRDREWLERIFPAAQKLAAMIEYYRTTPEPHWVNEESLEFGDTLQESLRQRLRPGACDGFHPEYTEAWDIAGVRTAALLAETMKDDAGRDRWRALAERLLRTYEEKFGPDLKRHEYANYSVLWPCRLFPLAGDRAKQFAEIGAQQPSSWRYFPLARAHQGLLAGNRPAGHGTLGIHLDDEQMRGWYAFDEGGPSAPGNWMKVRSNWKVSRHGPGGALSAAAMPHGWAIAEMHLLLRDSLAFEDEGRLVLFAGIPEAWFREPMRIKNMPTHFGALSLEWQPSENGGRLSLTGDAAPPMGFVVRTSSGDVAVAESGRDIPVADR